MKNFLNGTLSALALLASSSAFAYGGFASIVFDRYTGQWGSFHGAYSHEEATQQALARAGLSYYDLQSGRAGESWARNGWAALIRCNDGNFRTPGDHFSQYAAEQQALAKCGTDYYGNPQGYVVRSLASYVDYPDQSGTDTGRGF